MTGRRPVDVPAEALARIRELFIAGNGVRRIAREIGLGSEVVRRRLKPIIAEMKAKGELPPPAKSGRAPLVTPELKVTLSAHLRAGVSLRQMARDTGISASAIAESLAAEIAEIKGDAKFLPRRERAATAQQLAKRKAIVEQIVAGDYFHVIAERWGMKAGAAFYYTRYLTPEQAERRKQIERDRGPAPDQSSPFRPHRDDTYAKFASAMPKWLSDASRDDALGDMYVAYLEGRLTNDIAADARLYAARTVAAFESKFGPRSLDERLFDDSATTLGDALIDPAALEAFDYIFEEAR